jgi:ABC-type branched-subunit amino acid transport system ATPase component/predicted MFS family arabinose efflux permease
VTPPDKTATPTRKRSSSELAIPDEAVDLGDVHSIDDGETLVLRHMSENATGGIPSTGVPVPPQAPAEGRPNPFKQFVTDVKAIRMLRRTPYGFGPASVLTAVFLFSNLDDQAFAVARPEIVRDLEIDINTIVSIQTFITILTTVLVIFGGWYFDRHKRAPWVGISTTVGGLSSVATAGASNAFTVGAPRIAASSVGRFSSPISFSLLADYYPPEARGRAYAFLGSMENVASVLAIFAAGAAVQWLGWRPSLVIFGALLALTGVFALVRLREPVRGYMERKALGASEEEARIEDEGLSFGEAWRATWSVRTLRRVFIGQAISYSGTFGASLYFIFFLTERYGLDAWQRSLISLPSVLAAIIGGVYGGGLIDRFTVRNPGRVLTVIGGFTLIGALGYVGYAVQPPLWILLAFGVLVSFGTALIGPAVNAVYAQVIPPNIRTQAVAVIGLAVLPSGIVFVPIARVIFSEYGYGAVFMFAVPFVVIGSIILMTAGSFFDIDARSAFASAMAEQEWRRARRSGKGKLLVCRDIDVAYDGVQVLFGVDFDVEEGEIIALLGTNGAGKSTLLRAISGTTEAASGAIVFDGREITHMPPHETAARGVIHMPGGRGVFPGLSVLENLTMANWLVDDVAEAQRRLGEVFEIFPILKERADTLAGSLSGGEQQQLSLAQAFLARPRLLMIDELSLGLSPAVVGHLLEIVREIHKRGVTIIVVEQSVNVALTLAEKAIFMEKGEVKFFGKTADLLARPDILRAVYVKGTGALTDGAPTGAARSERRQRELELSSARPVLQVENLVKRYGGVTAVDDVTFDLREGEVLGLIGPNGAGKTTIFDLITGFQPLDGGRVGFEGIDITGLRPEERARRGLIRRFQDARLFPALTVFETLLIALEQKLEVRSSLLNAVAAPQARRAERRLRVRAERLIELFELQPYRDKFVKELSTGLRRIVDLACVIATEPKVLLLDEPSSGIAQAEAEGLAPLLRRIRFETGCSILIIEHDMPLISAVSDELLALDRGRPVTRGRPDVVLNDERVIESYLGTSEAAVRRSGSTT